ncbi:hypothetical protein WM42_1893 [Corynebacterium simulans]|nr:hypothetical protein WM42_1893 [Corynebacterium simulans]
MRKLASSFMCHGLLLIGGYKSVIKVWPKLAKPRGVLQDF